MNRLLSLLVGGRHRGKTAAKATATIVTQRQTVGQQPPAGSSQASLTSAPADEPEDIKIPKWFLGAHVRTTDELRQGSAALVISNSQSANTRPQDGQDENGVSTISDRYEMNAVFIDAICNLVRQDEESPVSPFFSYDVVQLRFPLPSKCDKPENLGSRFLQSAVEHLARELGAHLVTLTFENLAELVLHLRGAMKLAHVRDATAMLKEWFDDEDMAAQVLSRVH